MKNQNPKVMLIVPPRSILKSSVKRCCTPLGLGYIAGVLKLNNIETKILDSYLEGYNNEIDLKNGYVRVGLEDNELTSKIRFYNPNEENSRLIKRFFIKHLIKSFKKYRRFIIEKPGDFVKIFGRVT